ncbi:MAG: SpoIVB peptidase S55 domain protein, partial [Selenomonadaceae bacterium]|nr:SpoIVB peptidase S55 domain protein [Selenomonadaceae bacterium]
MYRSWKKALIVSLAGAFFGMMPVVSAMPPIMPIAEVQKGMSGTGYTVVDESGEIRPFHVDIVGVVDNGKTATPLIMAKASGNLVNDTVGVLQGMSGSPIYVDGKLVGALSAGLKGMTPFTFFITPIEDMMELWKMPDTKNQAQIPTVDTKKTAEEQKKQQEKDANEEDNSILDKIQEAFESVVDAVQEASEQQAAKDKKAPAPEEKATWCLSGFDEASKSFLRQHVFSGNSLAIQPFTTAYLSKNHGIDYHASLKPGGMMGVALAYGDFSIGATGTVTAVDGKRILGFGHSYLHRGNVNYFLTDASVVGTVSSASDSGMKLSNIGNIIGRVNQDRETGVAGELGVFPSVVPMKVTVREHDLGREQSYTTKIAYDEDLLAQISATMAYASLSKTSDSLGGSTVQVHFTIRTDVAEDGKAERSNMFYNATDVGQIAVLEFAQAVNIICTNAERESNLLDIQMDIDVRNGRKT